MAEEEDPELTPCNGHTNTASTYRVTLTENNLKTSRIALPQLKM